MGRRYVLLCIRRFFHAFCPRPYQRPYGWEIWRWRHHPLFFTFVRYFNEHTQFDDLFIIGIKTHHQPLGKPDFGCCFYYYYDLNCSNF